jgi:hypothetical protein
VCDLAGCLMRSSRGPPGGRLTSPVAVYHRKALKALKAIKAIMFFAPRQRSTSSATEVPMTCSPPHHLHVQPGCGSPTGSTDLGPSAPESSHVRVRLVKPSWDLGHTGH